MRKKPMLYTPASTIGDVYAVLDNCTELHVRYATSLQHLFTFTKSFFVRVIEEHG